MAISDEYYYAMFGVDIGANKMYESPLNKIYKDISDQIVKQDEDNCMYAVNQAVGYKVDKQELIKALQYDRNQYEKGYADAKKEYKDKLEQIRAEILDKYPDHQCTGELTGYAEAIEDNLEIIDEALKEQNE